MKKIMLLFYLTLSFTACGNDTQDRKTYRTENPDQLTDIKNQLFKLQQELQALTQSNWATCSNSLSTAAKTICEIAQAATNEEAIARQGAITDFANQIESKIKDAATDFASLAGMWKKIYGVDFPLTTGATTPSEADCAAFNSNASTIECIKVQGSAISTLQTTVSVLSTTVNGAMLPVKIGNENVTAGPQYESVVRLGDQSQINAYSDGVGASLVLGASPIAATNGSSTVTITASSAHGLSVGNYIRMTACASGRGFTSLHLNDTFEVLTVPTTTTLTITLATTATSNGTLGGSTCVIQKFSGPGMSTIWTNASGSDTSVRKTTASKAYNWAICKTTGGLGKVCYDTTNRSATFGTISAIAGWSTTCASSGNITCK